MNCSNSDKPGNERRRTPRFPFQAVAEIVDRQTSAKFEGQVTHLSLNGCHLHTNHPFSQGSAVAIKLFAMGEYMEADASVIYADPEGVGLSFREVKQGFIPVLQKWLLWAMSGA